MSNEIIELTDHQRLILQLVAEGLTMQEIADRVGIGYETIRTHIDRLRRKVGVDNKTALAVWAVKNGYA